MATFEEILKACSDGAMPSVKANFKHPNATSDQGSVTVIKNSNGYRGIAVRFPEMSYDIWFHAEEDTDKRSRYCSALTLIKKKD